MQIGDNVIYTEDNWKYLATIIAKKEDEDIFKVSIIGLGKVVEATADELETL